VTKKQGKKSQKHLVVSLHQVDAPDTKERLYRVVSILLKAIARNAL